jgi:hypothetical protein
MTSHEARHQYTSDKIDSAKDQLHKEMEALRERVTNIETLMASTSAATTELLAMFKSVKGGFAVMGWLAQQAKWIASLAAALAGVYMAFKEWKGH